MSEKSFSRRRRGGHRFRPSGGMSANVQRTDRAASEARAEALGEKPSEESVFDHARHEREIQRAENLAAGLPADTPAVAKEPEPGEPKKRDFREPDLDIPAEVKEEEPGFEPVQVKEPPPKSIVDTIKGVAHRVVKKVQRFIKPVKKLHKEVLINAESLETRVAVLEEGKLEEFTIERTGDERLVGSIFKGKVKNLEDGLKAAFVDIGFEKNAFLHYWDIVPSSFDSSVEIVEREGRKRDKPRITQRDIPRLYPPGSDIIVQVTKGPIGTKGPRVTTNLALPGRYLVLLPNSDQSGISRKIDNHEERLRLKKILRELNIPEGMGVIIRTVGEGQQKRYFVRDLALLIDEWKQIQEKINKQPLATCVFQEPDLVERTVRDFLTEDVERIVIDSPRQYDRIREMIGRISQRSISKVKLYVDSQPVFDRFNITRQLEGAFARQVHLKSDRAKTHILPISQLGLMEMTRQRHTESVRAAVYDDCPYCKGRGKVKSALTMSVEIQRKLAEILKRRQRDESDFQLRIVVNPTVLERLRTEDEKLLIELEKRYFGKLSFRADPAFHAEQFQIVNVATNEQMASVGG